MALSMRARVVEMLKSRSWGRGRIARFESLEARTLLAADTAGNIFPELSLVVDEQAPTAERILVHLASHTAHNKAGTLAASTVAEGEIRTRGGKLLGSSQQLMDGIYAVNLAPGVTVTYALAKFNGAMNVAFAEADFRVRVDTIPDDTNFSSLWGLHNIGQNGGRFDNDIDAPEAWDVFTGSGNFVIAVIDTGVDYTHPDLAANIWRNTNEVVGNGIDDDGNGYIDDTRGWDFANDDNDPMDDEGHGTHVAGTIAAVGDNNRGVTGVLWRAKIMPLKFLDADGSGYLSDAVRALDYAVANGAKISNNSWGGGGSSRSLESAISRARSAGHIFVAAAGNEANNSDASPDYPGGYSLDNIVSVAATDRNDRLASFSNYGATTVDLAAPGVSIFSTLPGNRYGTYSGTSMAAPHVTGALALVWDRLPSLTYNQVIKLVLDEVTPRSRLDGKVLTEGRLNVNKAIRAGLGGGSSTPPPTPPATGTQEQFSTNAFATVPDGQTLFSRITINRDIAIGDIDVWIDLRHRNVSDLRIKLRAPDGVTEVVLAHRVGGTGDNFTVTTFDDAATQSISSGSAPFNGKFRPRDSLAAFNGENARGTWRLVVADLAAGTAGTLIRWGIAVRGSSISSSTASKNEAATDAVLTDAAWLFNELPRCKIDLPAVVGEEQSTQPREAAKTYRSISPITISSEPTMAGTSEDREPWYCFKRGDTFPTESFSHLPGNNSSTGGINRAAWLMVTTSIASRAMR